MTHKNHPGFSSGRTVKARDLHYIQRPADAELLDHCRNGRPAYILNSPQMGKSSLLAHTAEQLNATSHHAILLDLSQFPLPPREEEWFHNIVRILDDSLDLSTDAMSWWKNPAVFALPPYKRLTQLFREVILPEIATPLVLFIDEIERIATLPFREHFFEWLATLYESRETDSDFYRLSFVVCGVATPSQLIPDGSPLLFQWSHRVLLSDFTLEEARLLASGLSLPTEAANEAVEWIYRWTKGHPYLTQLLCQLLEEQHRDVWFETEVDECIENFIVGPQGLREPHFQFVRAILTEPDANGVPLLEPYLNLLEGKTEDLLANPPAIEQLRLAGVLGDNEEELAIRNPLYQEVFSSTWVKRHLFPPTPVTPTPEPQPVPLPLATPPSPAPQHSYALAAALFLLGVGILVWFFSPRSSPPTAVTLQDDPSVTIESSANLVKSNGADGTQPPTEALKQAQEKIQELEATIVRYQQVSEGEAQNLSDQRAQLEIQLVAKEDELSDLESRIQSLTTELNDQQNTHDQTIADLQTERAQLEAKATTATKDLETALEEVKTLQMAILKKSSLSPSEINKLMADRKQLDAQLKAANTELAVAHERARNFESQLTQQQQLVKTENQRHKEERERLESSIKDLETTVADARQMLAMNESTAREQAKLAQSELNRLQQDRATYQELLAKSQEELSSLKTNVDHLTSTLAQKDQAIQKEQEKNVQLTTELRDLRSQESQTARRLSQLETLLAQQQETADNTVTTLQQERDQLQTELSLAKKELNSAKTQVATLSDQLSATVAQAALDKNALQAIHTSSAEQTRRSEEKFTELTLARSTLQTQLQENQTALVKAQEHIKQLEDNSAKISEMQDSLRKTKEERDQYSQKLQGTEQQLAYAQDQIQSLERSLRAISSSAKSTSNPGASTEDIVKVVSTITSKLSQSPSPIQSKTARLLWARQAYELGLRTQGTHWNTIDRSLRNELHTSPIQLKGVPAKIHTLTFNPSGDEVLAGTSNGKILSWSISNPSKSPRVFTGHSAGILSVAISPDGKHMASGSLDSTIRLWDHSQPNTSPRILQAHKKGTTSLAFRPDGKQLASGSQDHTIRLWDLTNDQPQPMTLGAHTGRVNAIAYTPDGKTLLSGGDDLTLRVWDLQRTDSPPKILRGHQQSISTIAVHPSGWTVATGVEIVKLACGIFANH